jgi:hypothetical protein
VLSNGAGVSLVELASSAQRLWRASLAWL